MVHNQTKKENRFLNNKKYKTVCSKPMTGNYYGAIGQKQNRHKFMYGQCVTAETRKGKCDIYGK